MPGESRSIHSESRSREDSICERRNPRCNRFLSRLDHATHSSSGAGIIDRGLNPGGSPRLTARASRGSSRNSGRPCSFRRIRPASSRSFGTGDDLLITYHKFERPWGSRSRRADRDRHQCADLVHPHARRSRKSSAAGASTIRAISPRFPRDGRDPRPRAGLVGPRALDRQHALFLPVQPGRRPQFHPQWKPSVREASWRRKTVPPQWPCPPGRPTRATFPASARPTPRGAGEPARRPVAP